MGLLDKYIAKMAARAPQHDLVLTEQLGPDDAFEACSGLIPAAFERGGGGGNDIATRMLNKAVNVAATKISEGRHIGGEPGSMAQSLPRDGDLVWGALSARGLSFWSFGMTGTDVPPTLRYRIAGEQVAATALTGQKAQGGALFWRVTFADESFFDYRVNPGGEAFTDACAARWPAG